MRIWHGEGFTSLVTMEHKWGRWLFVLCIVKQDCLMEAHCVLCKVSGKGFVVCKRAPESRWTVWLINSVSSLGCPAIVPIEYEAVSHCGKI